MNEFLGWLNLLAFLLLVALVVFFIAAYITGGGLSDTEIRICAFGMMALLGLAALAHILDPNSPPTKRRRR